MSLVGSLEDLGLGDILQIVSLSRKSGLLMLHSEARRGRILLVDGQVRGGCVDGEPASLPEILMDGGFVRENELKRAADAAAARGIPLDQAIAEHTGLATEHIQSLLREQVEQAVLDMLAWRTGEFSFEVCEALDPADAELLLPGGINAQYLAMQATRLGDEMREGNGAPARPASDASDEEPLFSGEDGVVLPVPVTAPQHRTLTEVPVARVAPEPGGGVEARGPGAPRAADGGAAALRSEPVVSLVAIDRDLAALEWLKAVVEPLFERIHIFQDAEAGVARVRQYLSRTDRPVVLLGVGAGDATEALVGRLRALASDMPVLLLSDRADAGPETGAHGVAVRPPSYQLASRGTWPGLEGTARALREAVAPWAARAARRIPKRAPAPLPARASLERLKQVSQRLCDPSTRGEVLSLALEFAAESFSRVAIFVIRDGKAFGMAQRGLAKSGGPDDGELREIVVASNEPACFRNAIERRASYRGALADAGDRRLVHLLGDASPCEAFVAPIESGGEVVALLYADNLPEARPVGDATALEIVLQEAGLALDRALLERALAERSGRPQSRGDGP